MTPCSFCGVAEGEQCLEGCECGEAIGCENAEQRAEMEGAEREEGRGDWDIYREEAPYGSES